MYTAPGRHQHPGDKVVAEKWGKGPVIFPVDKPEIARQWGRFLGARYKTAPNVVWILGGDRTGKGFEPVWNAMAAGLAEGDGGAHLKTYHPGGGHSSSEWFAGAAWLDFNMLQSGHAQQNLENDRMIDRDYAIKPVKPVLDGEPRYENHPIDWNPDNGWFDAADVRQALYWSVFAGARRDLENSRMIDDEFGVGYEDECLAISLSYRRDYTTDRDVPPSTSVLLRFNLKTGDQSASSYNLFPRHVFTTP